MSADGIIIIDNSVSQSLQGSVRSSVQDGIDSERHVVEKQMLVPQVPDKFVDARAHSHASFSAPPSASHVSPVLDGELNILAALSQMLDQKIAPIHESQNKLSQQMFTFHNDVQSKFANHDSRLTTLEGKIDSVSSSDHAIDSHARKCINRVEQQMKFLSISLSSKGQATTSINQQSSKLDPRITTYQLCTMIVGGFPEQGSEAECTK